MSAQSIIESDLYTHYPRNPLYCPLISEPAGRQIATLALADVPRFPTRMTVTVNRAPVLTLWAAIVAERLGHPADTALTLGRAVAGSAARTKARSIGREERPTDRDADTPRLAVEHVTAPVLLLGKTIRLLPNADGELRAAEDDVPADPAAVERYIAKAFGDHLAEVRAAMQLLAAKYDPIELNRIGLKLYERFQQTFRPETKGGARRQC
jgi:hypothetical protein